MRSDEYEYAAKVGQILSESYGYRNGEEVCIKMIEQGQLNASGHPSYGADVVKKVLEGRTAAPMGWFR